MDIFYLLFQNLIPLYILIALGWIAGKFLNIDIKSIGALGIYVFMPIAVCGYIAQLDFKPIYAGLPIIVFCTITLLALSWLKFAKKIYPDYRANLLTMCATWGNIGYFALPIVIALYPPELVGVYMFMMAGTIFYEATIGYYIWMRGNLNIKQSLKKVIKFPSLYAIIIGLTFNYANYPFEGKLLTYWEYCRGAYIVIGMMIIGTALSKIKNLVIAPRFLSLAFLGKFIIWPLTTFTLIQIDIHLLKIFDQTSHQMLFLLSTVPPGANIAAFAATLNMNPEKAATTVLIGTLLALFSVPLMLALSGLF